ncbi:fibronectin type III domain-containing protein [Paenibacillus polymyxa]|uniref:fibronectin type III domain-containing protein n=1 Tax=Paenibacillus polymyxa TaxID=1406 RepID=UPI002024398F|nr:fibronectin type III domain-containing protein [Paenibacillus polymyxa]URJ58305.1 fibronectin type III domain-containing protein [Paenibacillus polymyxa]
MNCRLLKKISLILILISMSVVFFSTANTYAATVGKNLYTPESGWKRYDDSDELIKYHGAWSKYSNGSNLSKGYSHHTNEVGAYLSFSFKGSQVRILADNYTNKSKKIAITIDGTTEYFSENSGTAGQTLVYEKTGLSNINHDVIIKLVQADGLLSFDGIDINEDGSLVKATSFKLEASGGDGQVTLKWDEVKDAETYTVKYGTESDKYNETTTATKDVYGNFVIPGLTNGTKYYFVVSAKVNGVDSEYSNEASATPQGGGGQTDPEQPTGNRAILVVTMTTGLEKEFDLSMKEVNDFIAWYESKQAGSGSASYAINKHDNNKGPFSSRKDYMLFDRILTFEVSEYSK